MKVAKVAVASATYAIDRPYDYWIPAELEGQAKPGMRLLVSFGPGNRRVDGILLAVAEETGQKKLKSVLALLDDEPVLTGELLKLALWMREQYFCTVYDAARAILPSGLWFALKDCWRLAPGVDDEAARKAAEALPKAGRLVELLLAHDGCAEMGQIRTAYGTADPGPVIAQLAGQGILVRETSAARGIGDKTEQVAVLALPPEEAMALVGGKGGARAPLQLAAAQQLCAVGRVSARELCYFTGASMATLRGLERKGILRLERQEIFRRPPAPERREPVPIVLSEEQERAYAQLRDLAEEGRAAAALLYGVTGSGKTQVYLKLIFDVLARGKSAMVLVPEIALTPQLMELFTAYFGDLVAILHSGLSAGERYDEWKRLRAGRARVAVGTRSAVFAPLPDLGLIILDEEQEPSYKSEQTPRYHAREVAQYRCGKNGALLLLGSATPSIESMFWARSGKYKLAQLPGRYNRQALPQVSVVDMKEELRAGNGGSISRALARALEENLSRGEQSILFLNRRGASRMAVCGECGYVPACPRCSVSLTYHSANHRLMCHYCGHSQPLPERCPECGGLLNFVGAGTQKVEQELAERFPGVGVLRMDTDTVTATRSHEAILSEFREKKVPILVGTQMVAKGLDFENVTLVGVIAADQALYMEDFRAGERAFTLLTQVVGRAGRGEKLGRAVIQTYTPDHEVIRRAAAQDYDSFYEEEIRLRQLRGYAPFSDLFVLTASGAEESAVLRACLRLRQELERALGAPPYRQEEHRLLGPAPAAILKVNDRYRYRLVLSARNQRPLRELLAYMLRQAQADKGNRGVSLFIDVNPLN